MAQEIRWYSICHIGLRGTRVRNLVAGGCHVADSSSNGYYSVQIPVGVAGSLTGEVHALLDEFENGQVRPAFTGLDELRFVELTSDEARLKDLLGSPDLFGDVRTRPGNYWEQIKHLRGRERMAAFIAMHIAWDGIVDREPETLHCGSYLPWLELAEMGQ